jgi:hypothetical protein
MTIALGIGANTSIFTAVNGVMLKSFSFPDGFFLSDQDPKRKNSTTLRS